MNSSAAQGQASARIFLLITLAGALALAWIAYLTFQQFVEGQRQIHALQDGAALPVTPLWLFQAQIAAFAIAATGLLIALAAGRHPAGQSISLLLLCLGVLTSWAAFDYFHSLSDLSLTRAGEKPAAWTAQVQRALTAVLILSPPVVWFAYLRSSLLDRYLTRAITLPLALCFAGFVSIWLIIDLTDNGKDFMTRGAGLGMLGFYYLVQLPQMVLMVLPITLLLSLLFALGKLSQANEIISMLGSGRSLFRILRPIFALGLYATLVSLVLNFRWAPEAEAAKEGLLNKLEDIKKQAEAPAASQSGAPPRGNFEQYSAVAWMYSNSLERRFWFVGRVPLDLVNAPMRYVAIWCQGEGGDIQSCYKADSVTWDHRTREWVLEKAKVWLYNPYGLATVTRHDTLRISGWRETPWHVVSASYNAEHLGIPELTTYIRTNSALPPQKLAPYHTQWHFALAEPFRCLFIILMAAPLGIVHARGGVLSGVAASIGIFFALMFFDSIFLRLGQSGRIAPWMGAWFPNMLLGITGIALLYLRNANKSLPSLPNPFK